MNIFELLKQITAAQVAGQQLSNPSTWSNRAALTASFVVVLNAGAAVLNAAGINLGVSASDLSLIAQGLSVVGVYAANKLHVAANVDAGKNKNITK